MSENLIGIHTLSFINKIKTLIGRNNIISSQHTDHKSGKKRHK